MSDLLVEKQIPLQSFSSFLFMLSLMTLGLKPNLRQQSPFYEKAPSIPIIFCKFVENGISLYPQTNAKPRDSDHTTKNEHSRNSNTNRQSY